MKMEEELVGLKLVKMVDGTVFLVFDLAEDVFKMLTTKVFVVLKLSI